MTKSAKRRPKVLQMTGVSVGGSAEHVLLLAKTLDPTKYDVHVALWSGGPLDAALVETGLPVHFLDDTADTPTTMTSAKAFSGGRLRFVTGFVRLVRLMRSERFDVVQTHTSVAGFLGRVAAAMTRTPVRVHMLHSIASNEQTGGRGLRVLRMVERILDSITTHYIAGSDAIVDKFVESGLAESDRVTRIYYSMDMDRFESSAFRDAEGMRASLGAIDATDVVVTLVGRLEKQKGVEHLLDALPMVYSKCPNVRVAIVGDGSLRKGLERQAATLDLGDRVRFTGWLGEIGAVMQATDIMAIPSRWEAFGIVNLEAMAAGRPVIGFAVEGIPEVVIDGKTGKLLAAGDVDGHAAGLIELIEDATLRRRLGQAGRKRLERHFLPEVMVRQHEMLYDDLIEQSQIPS